MQRYEVLQLKDANMQPNTVWFVGVGGFSNITVNYHYHTDSTLDCTRHNTDTFGPVYLIVPHSNVFTLVAGGSRKS